MVQNVKIRIKRCEMRDSSVKLLGAEVLYREPRFLRRRSGLPQISLSAGRFLCASSASRTSRLRSGARRCLRPAGTASATHARPPQIGPLINIPQYDSDPIPRIVKRAACNRKKKPPPKEEFRHADNQCSAAAAAAQRSRSNVEQETETDQNGAWDGGDGGTGGG